MMDTIRHVLDRKGREVFTTSSDSSIDAAVAEMCRAKVGALLVIDEAGHPAGILSERDLLVRVLLAHLDPRTTRVGEVMTKRVICIGEDDSIDGALALMTHARCRHLPVVGKSVTGLVSIGDLVRAKDGDHEYELRMLQDYVQGRYPG
jgi:CBS domain-containing protein